MALRFLQIFLPNDFDGDLDSLLEGHEIIGTWQDAVEQERRVIHLLVSAEETEPIMDRFEQAFGNHERFRVVLFPVEAVLPRMEPEAEEDAEDEDLTDQANKAIGKPGRVSREELYHDVSETLGADRVFLAMTALSSVVAAVGLLRDDVAVIIGAMVIAPMLGPNVAMSLAVTLGDLKLLRRAAVANVVGVVLSLIVSISFGLIFEVDPKISAIEARTHLGIGDLALALAAGAAGTFAFTRGLSGAVIGVMVAVALMPPWVTFGMLLGEGEWALALGALSLVSANVVGINLAGVGTFLAQGVRPRNWWEGARAKKATRIAIALWMVLLFTLGAIVLLTQSAD